MTKVLFVCLGNICRSPAGAAILEKQCKKFSNQTVVIDSCGLGNWHLGQLPDKRMREALKRKGIEVTTRAQQFHHRFFDSYDFILAADKDIYDDLIHMAKSKLHKKKVHYFTDFSPSLKGKEVPDPYYGDHNEFDSVVEMIELACKDFLTHILKLSETT